MSSYNSPHLMIRTRQSLIAVFVLLAPLWARATDWSEPAAQFVREVAASTGPVSAPAAIVLKVRNVSSMTGEQAGEVRRALEAQYRELGVRLADAAPVELNITLSENVRGYVWIGQVRRLGGKEVTIIKEVPRAEAAAIHSALVVTLRRTLVWGQSVQPILDVMVVGDAAGRKTIVLQPEKVLVATAAEAPASAQQAPQRLELDIAHARPWPRDVRGRLAPAADHLFDAYLPGVVCAAATAAPPSMNCRESDDPWPLGTGQAGFYGGVRNFFTGALSPGIGKQSSVTPFYAAAKVEIANKTTWFFTGVDGTAREVDDRGERLLGVRDWGSGIASIKTDCGVLLLVSGNGDGTAPDTVRAYGLTGREPVAASAPLEFAGPVTALWSTAEATAATAIVHNLTTDKYEAFTLTAACNQ